MMSVTYFDKIHSVTEVHIRQLRDLLWLRILFTLLGVVLLTSATGVVT